MTFTVFEKIAGRIGRRYWLKRIDAALHGAYRAGILDSWALHEIDARAKYHEKPYRLRVAASPQDDRGRKTAHEEER